jgi:hypothetical protein
MLDWFCALVKRVKRLLLTEAALDLEAALLARHAERQAALLRRAAALEADGPHHVADGLRRQAQALDVRQPLALLAAEGGHDSPGEVPPPRLAAGTGVTNGRGCVPVVRSPRPDRKGS